MKKSFLYAAHVALITALLFTGCPQDSDDDDDNGGPVTGPGSDLSYIAYAFGDGIDTVKAVNHIYLGSNELVIPRGKTLDLATEDVFIQGITDESKIIAQGTIIFAREQNQAGRLDFTQHPGAKIIADRDFINNNVWIDYTHDGFSDEDWAEITDRPAGKGKTDAVIWANWEQIVIIETFEKFKGYTAESGNRGYLYGGINGKYLAIEAPPDGIGGNEATEINQKARGLSLYIVGEPVVFNSPLVAIDLSGSPGDVYDQWAPKKAPIGGGGSSVMNVSGPLFAYAGSGGEGSLTVAGNADVRSGQINAPGGLTVWGVLENKGDATDTSRPPITSVRTPLTAWTARLKGASFAGKVSLLGSITNTFGASASFNSNVEISGPSTFNNATFSGTALFNGTTIFVRQGDTENQVTFAKAVTFADNAYLHEGVKFISTDNKFCKVISGLPYSTVKIYLTSGNPDSVVELTETKIDRDTTFVDNVVFYREVEIGTKAAFEKNVTFKNGAKFTDDVSFGSSSVYGSASTTTIKGLATFASGKTVSFGTQSFANGGSQSKVYIEEAAFNGNITGIAEVNFGNTESPAIQFKAEAPIAGSLMIPSDGGIEFKDNTLTFTGQGGTLSPSLILVINNNAKVNIEPDAKITLVNGQFVFVLVQAAVGADDAGFEVTGSVKLDHAAIAGKGGTVKTSEGLLLNLPPMMGTSITAVGVDGVLIDLSEGGGIVFVGSASCVVFKNGGNMRLNDGPNGLAVTSRINTNAAIIAGKGANGSVALLTGSAGTSLVGTVSSGTTYVSGQTTAPEVDPPIYENLLSSKNGFVFVKTNAQAGSISVNTSVSDVTTVDSIAVFQSLYP